jgi:hypothetical protein
MSRYLRVGLQSRSLGNAGLIYHHSVPPIHAVFRITRREEFQNILMQRKNVGYGREEVLHICLGKVYTGRRIKWDKKIYLR